MSQSKETKLSPGRSNKNKRRSVGRFFSNFKRRFKYFFTLDVSETHEPNEKFTKGSGVFAGRRKINWLRTILVVFALIIVGVGVGLRVFGASARGVYSAWTWPTNSAGYTEFEHGLTINQVTPDSPLFWSHQFKFNGGDGGYVGLQSRGGRVNGTVGKTAVFSVFGSAMSATSGSCVLEMKGFDGYNTSGSSCRIPYEWVTGREYRLKVKQVSSDSTGRWWQAWVKDSFTGVETSIAKIKVPTTWKGLSNWSVMWTEYFGPQVSSCSSLPYSNVTFTQPIANGGAYKPKSLNNYLSQTYSCNNSSLASVFGGGVKQQVGNTPPTSKRLVYDRNATRVVECAYSTFMARKPDATGGAYWTNRYINSNYDLKALARGLLYSGEGQTKADLGFSSFITRMYTSCLNRTAPSADIQTWTYKYLQGLSKEDIFVFVILTSGQQIK